jgi:DNA-binding CsgD family transcriptional regulator
MKNVPVELKVDINPSYEWSPKAESLGVSHRELEVLALVVEGYKNKEIARILKIEHQSVKNHLQHLFKKLDVKNSTQAYIIALNLNLIRMRAAISGFPKTAVELTGQSVVEEYRKVISGRTEVEGFSDKDKRWLKVFLKEHGIDPDEW